MSAGGAAVTLYRALGEAAPGLDDPSAVVRLYELARVLGEVAHGLGAADEPSDPALAAVVGRALSDRSGLVALDLASAVLVPRLLVAVRDERVGPTDPERGAALDRVADLLVAQLHALAAARAALGAAGEGERAASVASLGAALEAEGMGESLSRP